MKNLHLIPNGEIARSYIEFVNRNFCEHDHAFFLLGKSQNNEKFFGNNTKTINKKKMSSIFTLIKSLYMCKKIFLHGLFSEFIILLLFIQPWLLRKSSWSIWGGDLYWYQYQPKYYKYTPISLMRRYVIKHMNQIIGQNQSEYQLAKLWYGVQAACYPSFMYPSNLYKEYDLASVKQDSVATYILIGNSADSSNNHEEIFSKLKKYKNEAVKIICPLSYGAKEYRECVIKAGTEIFGDKFIPLTEFMPIEDYLELLAQIDIAIFNHKRQQAMGNITKLLGLGKKVYIRDDITTWRCLLDLEIKVYSSNGDFINLFEKIAENEKQRNMHIVKSIFSEKKLKNDLSHLFES